MEELSIYNCHIHTLTIKHAPKHFLKLFMGVFYYVLGPLVNLLLRWKPTARLISWIARVLLPFSDNDLLDRQARFLQHGREDNQQAIFEGIHRQYPSRTKFIVLPMDLAYAGLGKVEVPLEEQHAELLELAANSDGAVIPFFAVDPRREGIAKQVDENIGDGKFRGIKIYPNLGFHPTDERLDEVYKICQERGVPVMTHCSYSGVWGYGLKKEDRMAFSHPRNYVPIMEKFPDLRICLAHFGGGEEWSRHLKSQITDEGEGKAWVRWITGLIRSGDYPNLYTDISYTVFMQRPFGLHVDFFDYLKVLLENDSIRTHVLFGSDYYMVEREPLTEKEVSIALRSRLGGETYFQIAHHNPKTYLGE